MTTWSQRGLAVALAAVLMSSVVSAYAGALITQEEAKLPPPKGAIPTDRRGILRGPTVELISPASAGQSPIHLQLKFVSYGGATIDANSVRATYLRTPNVDLTPRIKPYLQPSGVDMAAAELPPGDFMIRVDLKDSDGRSGGTSFVLKIAP